MDQYFPNGIGHYAAGGLLIGAGIGLIYLLTGRIAGISSFFTAVQSWWSGAALFRQSHNIEERAWKGVLVVALVVGAGLFTCSFGQVFVTDVQWWRLLIGGIFVGLGTRTARGCTSGHGICGMSALAPPSIVATIIFIGVAIATAEVVAALGVSP